MPNDTMTPPPGLDVHQGFGMIRARAMMRGVDLSDFDTIVGTTPQWSDWGPSWSELANRYTDLGERYVEAGWRRSAGEAHVRAGLAHHFAKLLAVCDDEPYRQSTRASVRATERGLALLDDRFEVLRVPFDGTTIYANLRFPVGVERPPVALMIPGTESTKEEFPRWEDEYLARGFATLSMNGPGQGEVSFERRIRPDYDVPVRAMLDAIMNRADLDLDRIGAVGMSLGGYYAIRAAAYEPRIKAVSTNGGPYSLGIGWDRDLIAPLYKAKFIWNLGASSEQEGRELAHQLSLAGHTERVNIPVLVVYGELDPLLDVDIDGHGLVDKLSQGELWLFAGGNHGVTNLATQHLGPAADWLLAKLG